ncbi:MAG: pilus assembly protein [Acidobacteria bacterium]|nr:pilus assembly protein [Acidobacteriota bacterium]MBI3657962.1 pilus assembly protein [Acidobacteriota bacterium]
MNTKRQRWTKQRKSAGATMVEFALTALVTLMLMLGIFEFGLVLYSQVTLQHAVAEGARFGVTGRQLPDGESFYGRRASIEKTIRRAALLPNSPEPMIIEISQSRGDTPVPFFSPGGLATLTIQATYNYYPVVPRLIGISGPITLKAKSVMRNEEFPDIPPIIGP